MRVAKIYDPELLPMPIPFTISEAPAGFPSPSGDYLEDRLDLNEHLINHPSSTYYIRVQGDSMEGAGIFDGNILVVDRSLEAEHGDIVVATIDGELVVKRLHNRDGKIFLLPENKFYKAIEIENETDLQIWGVVAHSINTLRGNRTRRLQ